VFPRPQHSWIFLFILNSVIVDIAINIVGRVMRRIVRERLLYEWIPTLDPYSRELLREALIDPDAIFHRLQEEIARRLRESLLQEI